MTRPLDIAAMAAFSEEVRKSGPAIVAALDEARRDRSNADAGHEAYRLIHSLKGAASMVGLPALAYLLNEAEEALDRALGSGAPLPDDLLALLSASAPQVSAYVEEALAGQSTEQRALELERAYRSFAGVDENPDAVTLRELIDIERRALAECVPAASAGGDGEAISTSREGASAASAFEDLVPSEPIPPELAEVFGLEAQEHLQTIARLTVHLQSSPGDREALLELRRAVHTIKGAAGVVGYKAASRLAHRMEDLLDQLYDGEGAMTPQALTILTSSSEALDDVIAGARNPEALRETLGRLFGAYEQLLGGDGSVAPAASGAPSSSPASSSPPPAPAVAEAAAPGDGAPAVERRRGPDRRRSVQDRRGGAQIVRIPFERLSELVRLVSELVINRSSFDQHYAALIDEVEEVKLSTSRLRRAAIKLETDFEARALARQPATAFVRAGVDMASGHGFDELEFDRYTDFHLLSREVTETASDIGTISLRLGETIGNFDGDLTRLGRLTRELQDKVMEFRMVPLATLGPRLERTVRVTAEECGKQVDFALEGDQVALDKTLLEEMSDPLLHLLRNAIDHGIEPPAVRLAAGKPARGRVVVRASHEGTDVVLQIEDDGSGLDAERIRATAVARGFVPEAEAAALGEDDLSALVFEPGFSTASRVSEVSGRGVGMDIVKAKVARVGGRIALATKPGGGLTVTVRVPMTLAITRILLVRAGGETVGLPLGAVAQIVRPEAAMIATVGTERVLSVDGRSYPLRDLATALGWPRSSELAATSQPVLIANLGGRRLALSVDEIVQSRDAVVKTLGSHLRRVQGIWGATLLGDGTVILILNPADLLAIADDTRVRPAVARAASDRNSDVYNVLVVDDSLSMRHVLSSAVKKAGWNPMQARDGVDALELLHRAVTPPDLILLDIEMPRMDGYEFLSAIRAQQAYRTLPVVMLTSRGGDKHREKALGLGATDYIVKPFQEEALLQTVGRLIRASRGEQRMVS